MIEPIKENLIPVSRIRDVDVVSLKYVVEMVKKINELIEIINKGGNK